MRLAALLALAFSILSPRANAVTPVVDLNVFYFTDSFTKTSVASDYKRTFYDGMVGFGLTKKGGFVLGWNYGQMTFSDNPGTETSLTVSDMGPKLVFYFDKDKTWALGFTYNLITTADYSSGSTTSELRGSSMKVEAGYLPMMWEGIYLGAKINYYQVKFTEEVTNTTTLTEVTDSRTAIYPSFSMTIRWD